MLSSWHVLWAATVLIGSGDDPRQEPMPEPAAVRALAAVIDREIEAGWDRVVPAPRCSDAEFARRAYLDLIGRIPRVAEIRRFLDDPDATGKRERLVAELMRRPACAAHLATVLRGIWLPQTNENPEVYHLGLEFEGWLRPQLQESVGLDEIVRRLLAAPASHGLADAAMGESMVRTGIPESRPRAPRTDRPLAERVDSTDAAGATAFYEINDLKPEILAGSATRVLLGVRLECAQCHDHPFDTWTQDQFWQTAAFFTQQTPTADHEPAGLAASPSAAPQIAIPQTDRRVTARLIDGTLPDWDSADEPRAVLARWITSPANPYFAKNISNRLWAVLMGRGLVEPVDDLRADNPASHPELLDALAKGLVEGDFDARLLIAAIMASRAYQRSSAAAEASPAGPYARRIARPLSAEQLWQSLVTATGYRDPVPLAHRALAGLPPETPRGEFVAAFLGTPDLQSPQMSMTHALKLMQGEFLARMTDPDQGPLLSAVASAPFFTMDERLETLYLATLSRRPTAIERDELLAYLEDGPDDQAAQRLGNVFWALLNSSEFLLNH